MDKKIAPNKNVTLNVRDTMEEYLTQNDWRVNENSNQGFSLGGMILNTAGKVTANYWLDTLYPTDVSEAHRTGALHIHDLGMFSGYCAGWSLRALLEEGFNGVPNKVESDPPKNLSTAMNQMVNFLGTLQNEWAGAQAFSSFDTYLAPYVRKYSEEVALELLDLHVPFESEEARQIYIQKRTYKYVYDCIQSFVFNLNIPSRWGTQTPFTNITFDWNCPPDLREKRLLLGGVFYTYTFAELEAEMHIINRAFIEVVMKGDAKGRVFTFPIPTYNITPDFDWESPEAALLFEMTAKYGLPYFQNFLNSDLKPHHVRSMCCRLQLDLKELVKRGNGLFGSAEMTGSIGVVTINAARLGYLHQGDKEGFFYELAQLMVAAKTSLEIKRTVIQEWIDLGLFPFTKRYLHSLRNHFSTIGVNGVNEAIRNFFQDKEDIATTAGKEFAEEVLIFMRQHLVNYQEETGHLYNLEASPAEGVTYRFAKEDKKRYPEIIQAGTLENPYYTNSTQLPVEHTDDAFEALYHQDSLQTKYTGGTVLHLYLGERLPDGNATKKFIQKVLSNFRLPYITISPTFSICPKHGYLSGEYDFCPTCDREIALQDVSHFDHEYRQSYTSTLS